MNFIIEMKHVMEITSISENFPTKKLSKTLQVSSILSDLCFHWFMFISISIVSQTPYL